MSISIDSGLWRCEFRIEKFWGDDLTADPYEVIVMDNMLMCGGVSLLWEYSLGNGVATAGQTLTYLNNAQSAIGVGDSNAAENATHNNLQAVANKLRKGMNAGFPAHTDGTAAGNKVNQFQSTFATSEANWAWQECAVFNSAVDGTGRMLNRKVQSLGTKTNASSWQVTASITID